MEIRGLASVPLPTDTEVDSRGSGKKARVPALH